MRRNLFRVGADVGFAFQKPMQVCDRTTCAFATATHPRVRGWRIRIFDVSLRRSSMRCGGSHVRRIRVRSEETMRRGCSFGFDTCCWKERWMDASHEGRRDGSDQRGTTDAEDAEANGG